MACEFVFKQNMKRYVNLVMHVLAMVSALAVAGAAQARLAVTAAVLLGSGAAILPLTALAAGQTDFGAYYTQLNTGQAWESFSRTGKYADIVVRIPTAGGQLVFWRGNSYLPYWKTDRGQWDFAEIVPRSGDGATPMPDRVNAYSHVEIIANTPSAVVVHWRYLASFTAGNPHGNVSPNHFVDEVFTITPAGRVERVVKQGTDKIDDWNDPLNQTTVTLQLSCGRGGRIEPANAGAFRSATRNFRQSSKRPRGGHPFLVVQIG